MATVLIVDDDPDSCETEATALRRAGHSVTTARNGREALSALLISNPSVLVLDVRMPEMDGISLLEVLRSYLRWTNLPVVLVTAHATENQLSRADELGVQRVFHKSRYELQDLVRTVDELSTSN